MTKVTGTYGGSRSTWKGAVTYGGGSSAPIGPEDSDLRADAGTLVTKVTGTYGGSCSTSKGAVTYGGGSSAPIGPEDSPLRRMEP